MIVTTQLALLGTLTALLGVVSHLTIFTRIEWQKLAPLLIWVYPALAFLLFLLINSFETDLRTCLEYLFILVMSYCMGLFTSFTIVKSLRRKYRPITQTGPEEIAMDSSISAALDGPGNDCEKAMRNNSTHWSGQGFNQQVPS